jgi:hypothetical protein
MFINPLPTNGLHNTVILLLGALLNNDRCLQSHRLTTGLRGVTIKFANSPPCACRGSSGQKAQYGLMTLAFRRFTAVLLLIYGSLFPSGVYYCLSVFWCAVANNSWILHHDNASKEITVLELSSYSPDLAPVTFSVPEDKGNIEREAF